MPGKRQSHETSKNGLIEKQYVKRISSIAPKRACLLSTGGYPHNLVLVEKLLLKVAFAER